MPIVSAAAPPDVHSFLRSTELLASLDPRLVEDVAREVEWLLVLGGETLFFAGEPGDSIYFVVSGRLQVVVESPSGSEEVVREVGRGENVGELSLITDEPRSATVRAIRDTHLGRLSSEGFTHLLERAPRASAALTKMLARWLGKSHRPSQRHQSVATVALVPVGEGIGLSDCASRLAEALRAHGSVLHVNAARADAACGQGASEAEESDPAHARVLAWVNDQEAAYNFVVYEAEVGNSAWTRRCLRQADRVLHVASTSVLEPPRTTQSNRVRGRHVPARAREELLLIHPDDATAPRGTMAWLGLREFSAHHHVRRTLAADYQRLARRLAGRSICVVLSGGGARAFAHIGVLRAFESAGIPIDRIGGASMGAVIAAQYASGIGCDEMVELNRKTWIRMRPLTDYTVPVYALLSGRRGWRALDAMFGDRLIEDFWIDCFCVSSNLTRAEPEVHSVGPAKRWVMASMAIPGIVPPIVSDDGELLIDGAVLANLPIDAMRKRGDGTVVAVDASLSNENERRFSHRALVPPSPWRKLAARLTPWGRVRGSGFPGILEVLVSATTLPGKSSVRRARSLADLYLQPPVHEFDFFGWESLDELVAIGYRHANVQLERWRQVTGETQRAAGTSASLTVGPADAAQVTLSGD